jgi:phage FluMu gp28-like protein
MLSTDLLLGIPTPVSSPAGRGENKRRLDSTVLLIARVDWQDVGPEAREPVLAIEGVHWWTGVNHRSQYETLLDLLRNVWRVRRLAVDATGLGAPIADFLTTALGSDVVDPVTFTAATKSDLAYNLLAAIGGGRLKWYAASEDDLEAREFWEEARACRYQVRPNRTMSFFVPDGRGHDDFITALALLASAARTAPLPPAAAMIVARDPYGE